MTINTAQECHVCGAVHSDLHKCVIRRDRHDEDTVMICPYCACIPESMWCDQGMRSIARMFSTLERNMRKENKP